MGIHMQYMTAMGISEEKRIQEEYQRAVCSAVEDLVTIGKRR
jgi:hypothetical protein